MIRPVTCICFLLAGASGLYLYQSKHRVQVLDREIEQTVRATDAMREQIRVLHADWTLMNDPQRLQALADQFLSLKTVTPGQFTTMAEIEDRLPAIRPPEPPPQQQAPVATVPAPAAGGQIEEPQPQRIPAPAPAPASEPSKPAVVAVASPPARLPERKPPAPPRPQIAQAPPPPRSEVRPVAEVRPVFAPEPARPAPVVMAPAVGGSMLGMAHGMAPPPRPMPVSAPQWITTSGGGGG